MTLPQRAQPGRGAAAPTAAPAPPLLHHIFLDAAARHPQRTAIEVPPGHRRPQRLSLSYARLQGRAQAVAAQLQGAAAPDAVVGILLPREDPDLYAAQLGVLLSGAAFACLDPRQADGLLQGILQEMTPVALLTDAAGAARLAALALPGLPAPIDIGRIPALGPRSTADPAEPLASGDSATADHLPATLTAPLAPPCPPSPLAYLIYTSGTTGRPKGVMIEHDAIVGLVRSDVAEFGLGPADRVAQCSSPAYDSSIEEAWLALAVGATLVVLDDDTVRLGPDLVPWLRQERITVLCPPPTLLRATGCPDPLDALPQLRLLYVGGEALPQDLADRWSRGRRMVNGYGPTECTVTVTRATVRPGEAVTIGKPVPGSQAWVLDEALQTLPDGQRGELCIAGRSLARGYRGQAELSAQRFPQHPYLGRLYRTGDLVRRRPDGNLDYLGRLDAQVKLRGYRVELGAVEAALAAQDDVRAAACCLQGQGAAALLAAHVLPADPAHPPDLARLQAALRQTLPDYMVPSRLALIAALPVNVSGKLDRALLPDIPAAAQGAPARHIASPAGPAQTAVRAAFAAALGRPPADIAGDDDFFLDLGGDSLSAVAAILALRDGGWAAAAVRDLYETRQADALAERLGVASRVHATLSAPPPSASSSPLSPQVPLSNRQQEPSKTGHRTPPRAHPRLATLLQALWILLELWVGGVLAWLLGFQALPWLWQRLGLVGSLLAAPLLAILGIALYLPASVALTALAKRLLIGRYQAGRFPVWGGAWLRHWLLLSIARLIPWELLAGTVLLAPVLRALGARVGARLHVHRGVDLRRGGWDLLDIGDDVTLCQDAALRLTTLADGHLVVAPVALGSGATVDTRGGVDGGSSLGDGAFLAALSWLPAGSHVPAGQRWDGVPAGPAGPAPAAPPVDAGGGPWPPLAHGLALLLAQILLPTLRWLPLAAVFALLGGMAPQWAAQLADGLWGGGEGWSILLLFIFLPSFTLPLGLALQALALRLSGPLTPGVYSRWSAAALRIWLRSGAVDSAGAWLSGSLLWPPWLRLAGMRIGRDAEVSTIIDLLPETVTIGGQSFFADGIYFCQPLVHRGTVTVAATRLGRHSFLGNHGLVTAGLDYPDDFFLGVATVAGPQQAERGGDWFGHPPLPLPRRQVVAADDRLTYHPDALRYATRLFWELSRFALPALPMALALLWWRGIHHLAPSGAPLAEGLLVAPAVTAATLLTPLLAIIALKWLLLGRVRPGRHAFWSCWCGRWDFLYVAWGQWARALLGATEGTLLLNAFLRLTGMDIGRRVVLGPGFAQVVDPDMLHLGDDATVSCHFQAHSFEDRVLKIDHLTIGPGATVGPGAVVFYGVHIGAGAQVGAHAVVMKMDRLAAGGRYAGHPAREG